MEDMKLPIEQVVYVPSTNKQQKIISPTEMAKRVAEVKRYLSEKYGGFTSVKGEGGYEMNNKLVQEGVVKVTSFATKEKHMKNRKRLVTQLRNWGNKWGQESMGLEVEGDLAYVYSSKTKPVIPITTKQMTEKHSPSWIETETRVWN